MIEELTSLLTKSEVPGKILVASLWYLTHNIGCSGEISCKSSKRLLSTSESLLEGNSRKRRKTNQVSVEERTYCGVELEDADCEFDFPSSKSRAKEPEEQGQGDDKATKTDNAKVP